MTLSTIERVLFLKSVGVFGVVSGEDLAPLAAVAQEVRFVVGNPVLVQGEFGDCLYIVVDGEVTVSAGEGEIAVRGPGSVLGEMAVLSGRARSATCIARTDLFALRLSRDDFLEMLTERPALAIGVIEVLTNRLDEMTQKLAEAGGTRSKMRLRSGSSIDP